MARSFNLTSGNAENINPKNMDKAQQIALPEPQKKRTDPFPKHTTGSTSVYLCGQDMITKHLPK